MRKGFAAVERISQKSVAKSAKRHEQPLETPEQLQERYLTARAKDAYELFLEMSGEEQQSWLA